jgi:hypothetical protein
MTSQYGFHQRVQLLASLFGQLLIFLIFTFFAIVVVRLRIAVAALLPHYTEVFAKTVFVRDIRLL